MPMLNGKFHIGDIVHPEDRGLAQQFLCAVCLHIVEEPVQTPCGHIFCGECLDPLQLCPTCRDPLQRRGIRKLAECNKPMVRMMLGIKVHCPYHEELDMPSASASASEPPAKRQKHEASSAEATSLARGCDWVGSYGDLMAKHMLVCSYFCIQCPHGCGETLQRCNMMSHEATCPKKFEQCSICMQLIRPGCMAEHRAEAAELHVQLLEQKLVERQADAVSQSALEMRLQKMEETISGMKSAINSLAKTQHVSTVTKQSTETMRLDIRKHFCKKVMWTLKNVKDLLGRHPKGTEMQSEAFCFGGSTDFHLIFWPNGVQESEPNKCALFLKGPPGQFYLHARLSINDVERTLAPHGSGWHEGFGANSFWDKPLPTDDSVVITVEVLDSAYVLQTA